MRRLQVELPYPPSLNKCYRNVPGIGRALTGKAERWKERARILIRVEYQTRERISEPVTMTILLRAPDWRTKTARAKNPYRKRDASNAIKLLEDAVAAECFEYGDEQVWRLMVLKQDAPKASALVIVEPYDE